MVCLASVRRRAIVLRTLLSFSDSNGIPKSGADAATGGTDAATLGTRATTRGAAPLAAASTSAFTIRPPGPLPVMPSRSTPACAAIRLASGDAIILSPLAVGIAGTAGVGAATATDALSVLGGAGAAATGAAAVASSPSPASVAITVPTLTPSVPSATLIAVMTPSSTASNSIVALSVSISARISPDATVWPTLTSHLASVPSSMVGESAGILSSIAIVIFRSF